MNTPPPVVHIVDDDAAFLRSTLFMVEGLGFAAQGYALAEDFLAALPAPAPQGCCLLLDIRMPRISGLELQRRLTALGRAFPIVFMTGHGDIDQAVQAMRAGAIDFLQKPFREQALLDALNHAVGVNLATQRQQGLRAAAQELLGRLSPRERVVARLSPRERDVARQLALGLSNKEVARQLNISDHTVHVHRQRITEKTGSGHAADLARLILRADPRALDDGGSTAPPSQTV